MDAGQNGLHLHKCLHGGGRVKDYDNVVRQGSLFLEAQMSLLRFCILSKLAILVVVITSGLAVTLTACKVWF
jgi:hypothetical protein